MERISRKNLAIDNEEQMIGERCLAVPIRDQTGKIIAAISISGPTLRLTSMKMKELGLIILGIGLKISKQMGFEENLSSIKSG